MVGGLLIRAGTWLTSKAGIWKWPLIAGGTAAGGLLGADVAARAEDSATGGFVNSVLRMFGMNQTDVGVDVAFAKFYNFVDSLGQMIENTFGPSDFTRGLRNWAQNSMGNLGQEGPATASDQPSLTEAASSDWASLTRPRAEGGVELNWSGLGNAAFNATTGLAHGALTAPAWALGGALDLVNAADNFLGFNIIGDSQNGYRNDAARAVSAGFDAVGLRPDLEGSAIARTFNFVGGVAAGTLLGGATGIAYGATAGGLVTSFAPAADPDQYARTGTPAPRRDMTPAPAPAMP